MTGVDAATLPWTDEHVLALSLLSLPAMTPPRLRVLLANHAPSEVWEAIGPGFACAPPERVDLAAWRALLSRWATERRRMAVGAVVERYRRVGVGVLLSSDPAFPERLREGTDAARVVLFRGDPTLAAHPKLVSIVGTRKATPYGLSVATRLGRQLAEAGMVVVSGLAIGIDGAAHTGALSVPGAGVIGVVGSGINTIYPRRHRGLWQQVGERGFLLTESPLDGAPVPANFPDRNRLIAALAPVLVIVESPRWGGAMHTVDHARALTRIVMAVPGPIDSVMSEGPNWLLNEHVPCRNAVDVEVAVGWAGAQHRCRIDDRPEPSLMAARALATLTWEPISAERVAERSALSIGAVLLALSELERDGWAGRSPSGWARRAPAEP